MTPGRRVPSPRPLGPYSSYMYSTYVVIYFECSHFERDRLEFPHVFTLREGGCQGTPDWISERVC